MQNFIGIIKRLVFMEENRKNSSLTNQEGSIIFIALMVLAIMTVIGLISSDTLVTENFIVRNTGIYKQNVNIVESAVMEGLQEFMQIPDGSAENFEIDSRTWFSSRHAAWTQDDWYDSTSALLLDGSNSEGTSSDLLDPRGEDSENLRYAFVGWEPVLLPGGGSESIVVSGTGQTIRRRGRILAEYVSLDGTSDNGFGMLRMEIGVQRRIPIN